MKTTRNKSAWVVLAVAVMVVATLARAEAGRTGSTAYVHPVLGLLSGHANAGALTSRDVPQLLKNWSALRAGQRTSTITQARNSGVWQTMLPVLFIGLAAPLNLISFRSTASACRVPSLPALSTSFQRPPPARLA